VCVTLVRRLRRNFATVLTGNAAITVLGFATVSLNARSLGLTAFGTLLVIQSLTELFNRLASLQTWQAMNAFGAAAAEQGNYRSLLKQFRFGFMLDCIGAGLGTISAIVAVVLFGEALGVPPDARGIALFYTISALFLGCNAGLGLLRLLDSFGLAMTIQAAASMLLLANATILWATGQPLWVYVVTTALISITAPVGLNIAAYTLLMLRARSQSTTTGIAPLNKRAFLKFTLAASGDGTLNVLRQRGELLLVSSVLGPAAAGLFGVAYRLASLMNRFSEAGRQSVYPELAKLVSSGDRMRARRIVIKSMGFGLSVATVVIAIIAGFGAKILALLFGQEFSAAYVCLVWLSIATLGFAMLFAASPYVQLVYGAARSFSINLAASAVFIVAAWFGPMLLGLEGAGLGSLAFSFTFGALVLINLFLLKPPSGDVRERSRSKVKVQGD